MLRIKSRAGTCWTDLYSWALTSASHSIPKSCASHKSNPLAIHLTCLTAKLPAQSKGISLLLDTKHRMLLKAPFSLLLAALFPKSWLFSLSLFSGLQIPSPTLQDVTGDASITAPVQRTLSVIIHGAMESWTPSFLTDLKWGNKIVYEDGGSSVNFTLAFSKHISNWSTWIFIAVFWPSHSFLLDMWFINLFFQSIGYLFNDLKCPLTERNYLVLIKYNVLIFYG